MDDDDDDDSDDPDHDNDDDDNGDSNSGDDTYPRMMNCTGDVMTFSWMMNMKNCEDDNDGGNDDGSHRDGDYFMLRKSGRSRDKDDNCIIII